MNGFKQLIEADDNKRAKINSMIDGQGLIMFFKHDNKIYGCPEESRVVFARMKNPSPDIPKGWAKDANFIAFDLIQGLLGQSVRHVFDSKDLAKIKIIPPEEAEKTLMNNPSKGSPPKMSPPHDENGAGIIAIKDRK